MELISIVIPAYNAEKTIRRAIDSLLKQTYKNIEVIVIDDGSHDGTAAVCAEIEQADARIKLVSINNAGVSNARNVGIDNCHGKYIAFLDADDYVEPEFIETFAFNINENVDLICSGYKVRAEDGKYLFEQTVEAVELAKGEVYRGIEALQNAKSFNVLWNKMFRKSIIDENHIRMDTRLSMGEDFLFILEYLDCCSNGIKLISKTDYNYVLSQNGLQATFKDNSQLRLKQLEKLEIFYKNNNYKLDGFYREALRTVYIVLLESGNSIEKIKGVLKGPMCRKLCGVKVECTGKYKALLTLLKINNAHITAVAVWVFKKAKRVTGKSYEW